MRSSGTRAGKRRFSLSENIQCPNSKEGDKEVSGDNTKMHTQNHSLEQILLANKAFVSQKTERRRIFECRPFLLFFLSVKNFYALRLFL